MAAILWHFCYITFKREDFVKFLYFRSARCETKFQWSYLNITEDSVVVETTDESYVSRQTLLISVIILIINFVLIVSAAAAICKLWIVIFNWFINKIFSRGLAETKGWKIFQLLRTLYALDCDELCWIHFWHHSNVCLLQRLSQTTLGFFLSIRYARSDKLWWSPPSSIGKRNQCYTSCCVSSAANVLRNIQTVCSFIIFFCAWHTRS